MKNKIIILILILLVLPEVYSEVASPLPELLELHEGESGRFKFDIQNTQDLGSLACDYSSDGEETILELSFDHKSPWLVEGGKVRTIKGNVTLPQWITKEYYEQKFCIKCSPLEKTEEEIIQTTTCNLSINVRVLEHEEEPTKKPMDIPLDIIKKETQEVPWTLVGVFVGALIIIALATVIEKNRAKKKDQEKRELNKKTKKN